MLNFMELLENLRASQQVSIFISQQGDLEDGISTEVEDRAIDLHDSIELGLHPELLTAEVYFISAKDDVLHISVTLAP